MHPHLTFDGNCAEAFEFYAKLFDGKIEMMTTFADRSEKLEIPSEWGTKILHAELRFNNSLLMGSDAFPGSYKPPQGLSLALLFNEISPTERVFNALAEGGEITMDLQKTFWAERFGVVTDRFGTPWQLNCDLSET